MLERRTKGSPERAGLKVPPPGSPALRVLYQLFKHVMAESLSDLNLPSFSGRRERRREEGEGRGAPSVRACFFAARWLQSSPSSQTNCESVGAGGGGGKGEGCGAER